MPNFQWVEIEPGRQRLVDIDAVRTGDDNRPDPGVRGARLTLKERKGYQLQLGARVRDRNELEAAMKAGDFRFVEPGETQDRMRKDVRQWLKEPAATRGTNPVKHQRRFREI